MDFFSDNVQEGSDFWETVENALRQHHAPGEHLNVMSIRAEPQKPAVVIYAFGPNNAIKIVRFDRLDM